MLVAAVHPSSKPQTACGRVLTRTALVVACGCVCGRGAPEPIAGAEARGEPPPVLLAQEERQHADRRLRQVWGRRGDGSAAAPLRSRLSGARGARQSSGFDASASSAFAVLGSFVTRCVDFVMMDDGFCVECRCCTGCRPRCAHPNHNHTCRRHIPC